MGVRPIVHSSPSSYSFLLCHPLHAVPFFRALCIPAVIPQLKSSAIMRQVLPGLCNILDESKIDIKAALSAALQAAQNVIGAEAMESYAASSLPPQQASVLRQLL